MKTLGFKRVEDLPKVSVSRADMIAALQRYMTIEDYKPLSIDIARQNAKWLIDTYHLTPGSITQAMGEDIKIDLKRRLLKPTGATNHV